jgi:hypothetical protein
MVAFRCYDPSGNGSGGVHDWYRSLSPGFRAEVDATLELLALEPDFDEVDQVKPLRGACDGLSEIIVDFVVDKIVQHIRLIGFDGPGKGEFTLLAGFQKFKDNSIYGYYCAQAHQRKEGVIRDGRRAPLCQFP